MGRPLNGPPNKNYWALPIIAMYFLPLIDGFTVIKVVKNFACGGLFPLLHVNFVHEFINYLWTTVTKTVKKFRLRRAFATHVFLFRTGFH